MERINVSKMNTYKLSKQESLIEEQKYELYVDADECDCDLGRSIAWGFKSLCKENNLPFTYVDNGNYHGIVVVKKKESWKTVEKILDDNDINCEVSF